MSIRCAECGAVASYGRELGHKNDCPSLNPNRKFADELVQSALDLLDGKTTLREEIEKSRKDRALPPDTGSRKPALDPATVEAVSRDKIWRIIAQNIGCEADCQKFPNGCGCAQLAADAVVAALAGKEGA